MKKRALLIVVSLIALASWETSASRGDDRLDKIQSDWEVRWQSVNTVEAVLEGTVRYPRGSLNGDTAIPIAHTGDFPDEDYAYPVTYKYLIDFKKNLYRSEVSGKIIYFGADAPEFVDYHAMFVSDGKTIWLDRLDRGNSGRNPQVEVISPDETFWSAISISEWPFFYSLGLVTDKGIYIGKMDILKPDVSAYTYVRDVRHRGRECRLLRVLSPPRALARGCRELTVDTTRASLPLRWASFIEDAPHFRAELAYTDESGVWRLAGWDFTSWSRGKLEYSASLKVVNWQSNVEWPNSPFPHKPRPNSVVSDHITKEYYRLNPDGSKTVLDRFGERQ